MDFLFIFAPENEMWKDLSSLQPQKKMLKQHPFLLPVFRRCTYSPPSTFIVTIIYINY